ncbi:MAG TPA: hypothetical protein VF027_09250 [Sphingomicrobium sp.]
MRAATKMLLVAGAALAIAGCKKEQVAQQNEVAANEVSPNADIEALPADESSATPSNELVNGDDSADANTVTNNAY